MKIFLLSIFLLFSLISSAHNYFFSFAEVNYNETSKKIETTIVATQHDIEDYLLEKFNIKSELHQLDSTQLQIFTEYINSVFSITTSDNTTRFKCLGIESYLNGTAQIYLESQVINITEEISFTFNLLMDKFDGQQNKITFKYKQETFNLTFIKGETLRTIKTNK